MEPVKPLSLVELFPGLHAELVVLLRGLEDADWNRPTACGDWLVRDIVAHLLDGDVRKLSFQRDGQKPPSPERELEGYRDLVAFLNGLNAEWVRVMRRMSPRVLIDLIEVTGPQLAEHVAGLDPNGTALFPVAWAGESQSTNWFDIGREYTERWHHQQQIRDAVGAPPLTGRRWLHPVLEVFVRALPHAYRRVGAEPGKAVALIVTGEAGGAWSVVREPEDWRLYEGEAPGADSRVTIDQEAAWRLFCNQLDADAARSSIRVEGEDRLGSVLLGTRAVMV